MTEFERIEMVKAMAGETNEDIVSAYLFIASQKICKRLFGASVTELPTGYDGLLIEAAVYLLHKRGEEGELSHSENGTAVSYENADLPDSMFYGYTAKAEVVG